MTPQALSSVIVLFCLSGLPFELAAQVRPKPVQSAQENQEDSPEAPEQVIIEREAMNLIDPKTYQVPLQLRPSNFIRVVSPSTGVISKFPVKPGDQLIPRSELFQLENKTQELAVKRAEAQVALKKLQLDQAKGDPKAENVAAAELKVAELDLEIANAYLDKTIVRTEEAAEVYRTYAEKGEFVSQFQPVVDIGNPTTMTVEIPVNRPDVKADDTFDLKVEDRDVQATVVSVLPPPEEFEPLRDLYDSLGSARLQIDNRDRKLKAGQAVYVSTIPRDPVAEVKNSSIISSEEGQRKVQVIRKFVVRDIVVNVLAPVGADRSFISGPFHPDDELILTASSPLADGTQLNPKVLDQTSAEQGTGTRRPATGF